MKVVATHLLRARNRRGRLCVRPDGMFQFATESYNETDEMLDGYWMNEYPPSGLYQTREEAVAALRNALASDSRLLQTEQLEIELEVGPWEEPILRDS